MKKVSIIVPVYNREKTIKSSINSILRQTYEFLEIILINDGSTDNTLNILNEIAKTDERIKIINQENIGPGGARNAGLRDANGYYILFLDSDDMYYNSNVIKNVINEIEYKSVDLLVGSYLVIEEEKTKSCLVSEYVNDVSKVYSTKEYLEKLLKNEIRLFFNSLLNKVYKNNIIKQNNIKMPNTRMGEDYVFNMEYIKFAKDVAFTNDFFIKYIRSSELSLTKSYHINLEEYYSIMLKSLRETLEKYNIEKSYYYNELSAKLFNLIIHQYHPNSLNNTFIKKYKYNRKLIKEQYFKDLLKNKLTEPYKIKIAVMLVKMKMIFILTMYFSVGNFFNKCKNKIQK